MNKNFTIVASIAVISIIGHLAANWTGSPKLSYDVSNMGSGTTANQKQNLRNEPLLSLIVNYGGRQFNPTLPGSSNVVELKNWLTNKEADIKKASNIKLYINNKELKDTVKLKDIPLKNWKRIEMRVNIDRKPAVAMPAAKRQSVSK